MMAVPDIHIVVQVTEKQDLGNILHKELPEMPYTDVKRQILNLLTKQIPLKRGH